MKAKQQPQREAVLSAFEKTVLPHRDELLGSAIKLTRNVRDAEDLLQETLLKSFVHFHRFQQGTNARAWLFRIMTNTFINQYRRKVREREILENNDAPREIMVHPKPKAGTFNPEWRLRDRQLGEDIRKSLAGLPDVFRAVVVLADLEGFSYKDVADILDCPVGTVMSRLFRGRRLLRTQLEQYAHEQGIFRAAPARSARSSRKRRPKSGAWPADKPGRATA